MEQSLVTFVIPTIGRSTLSQTLNCLKNQTNPNWKAIVIFDGISSTIENTDPRIRIIESPKLGEGCNSAGLVRNYGITFADTEWIAFVDDDDGISNNYVDLFIAESSAHVLADIIVFRMINYGFITPCLSVSRLDIGNVGISFVVKKKVFDDGHIFVPSGIEDYTYLSEATNKNYNIMISQYVTYFVRKYDNIEYQDIGERLCLFKR